MEPVYNYIHRKRKEAVAPSAYWGDFEPPKCISMRDAVEMEYAKLAKKEPMTAALLTLDSTGKAVAVIRIENGATFTVTGTVEVTV